MKSLLWTLVKVNAVSLGAMFAAIMITSGSYGPRPKFMIVLCICLAYLLYWNIKTIVKARKEIAEAVKDGAIEAAARAIEFKEAANARVQQRLEERRNQER